MVSNKPFSHTYVCTYFGMYTLLWLAGNKWWCVTCLARMYGCGIITNRVQIKNQWEKYEMKEYEKSPCRKLSCKTNYEWKKNNINFLQKDFLKRLFKFLFVETQNLILQNVSYAKQRNYVCIIKHNLAMYM